MSFKQTLDQLTATESTDSCVQTGVRTADSLSHSLFVFIYPSYTIQLNINTRPKRIVKEYFKLKWIVALKHLAYWQSYQLLTLERKFWWFYHSACAKINKVLSVLYSQLGKCMRHSRQVVFTLTTYWSIEGGTAKNAQKFPLPQLYTAGNTVCLLLKVGTWGMVRILVTRFTGSRFVHDVWRKTYMFIGYFLIMCFNVRVLFS